MALKPWPWKVGDSDSGISSSDGSGSWLRRRQTAGGERRSRSHSEARRGEISKGKETVRRLGREERQSSSVGRSSPSQHCNDYYYRPVLRGRSHEHSRTSHNENREDRSNEQRSRTCENEGRRCDTLQRRISRKSIINRTLGRNGEERSEAHKVLHGDRRTGRHIEQRRDGAKNGHIEESSELRMRRPVSQTVSDSYNIHPISSFCEERRWMQEEAEIQKAGRRERSESEGRRNRRSCSQEKREPPEGHLQEVGSQRKHWQDEFQRTPSNHVPEFGLKNSVRQGSPRRVSLRRLTTMTSNHHLPRLPVRQTSLGSSIRSSSCSSLSQASSAKLPTSIMLSSSSVSSLSDKEEDVISLAHIDRNLIVHSYIASRGQREKEVEIYEYLPAYKMLRQKRSLKQPSVSVC